MGQGQEIAAYEAIRESASKGEWLCLNNLHLMLQAVPSIFKVIFKTQPISMFFLRNLIQNLNKKEIHLNQNKYLFE